MKAITYFGLEIHKEKQFDWVDANEIPEGFRPEFLRWMSGQTAPPIKDRVAVYRHDFERWYKSKFLNQPTYWD